MPVAVIKTDFGRLYNDLGSTLEKIGYAPSKERVVIKPCVSSTVGSAQKGERTDPRVVETIIRLFPENKYTIAESCFMGMSFADSMSKHGYYDLARRYPQVEIMDLEESRKRAVPWACGSIDLPEILFDHEYINVPTMKTHWVTTVSLGLKNQKGIVSHSDKKRFHRGDLHAMIKALGEIIQPDLTVIDGVVGREGNWPEPLRNRIKKAGVVICGTDVFEADRAACSVMGLDPGSIPHLGPGPVEYVERWMEHIRVPFRPPPLKRYWRILRGYCDTSIACSGCVVNMQKGMFKAVLSPYVLISPFTLSRWLLWYGLAKKSYWIMGNDPRVPDSKNCCVICIGDCTRDFASRHGYPHIPGCPPVAKDFFKGLILGPLPAPPP